MTSTEFGQFLCYRPVAAQCLQDILLDHYLELDISNSDAAALTKAHIDQLYARFVTETT